MTSSGQEITAEPRLNYVETHCQHCAAGQTIARLTGAKATYCLMMREWVTDKHNRALISGCDRYAEREPEEAAD